MLNIPLQMLSKSKRKKLSKGNQKLLKRLAILECQTPQQSLVRLIIMLNIPLQMASKRKKLKKRKSKIAKQAPPVEEMKDFFKQEFNKIWDSLNHVQKAIADLPKNTNTAQMSATIKVSAENKSQASTCDKQEEKTRI